jgi:hypothetical protein
LCHALVAIIFWSYLFYKNGWMQLPMWPFVDTIVWSFSLQFCMCPASHFALNILKTLVFLLPQQSFCTSPVPMCGFRWPVSVMDAFYVVLLMLHLTDLSFIYNFTAEHWYSESRK